METRQMKAVEWIDELEHYAKDKQLSMRMLDGIVDCKKKMEAENVDWNAISLTVEDLLSSIEQKAVPAEIRDKKEGQISKEAVMEQIKKMAQRCQGENQASVGSIEERKNIIVKMAYDDMKEITRCKAHLSELKDEKNYIQFFKNLKNKYKNNSTHMISELMNDISGNYNHLLEHIKSMLRSIGGHKDGIGAEKFYYDYESKREGLNNRVQSEVSHLDIAENEITNFGQRTYKIIRNIVKKLNKKRVFLAWLPLLVLLVGLTVTALATQENNQEVVENAIEESDEFELPDWVVDKVKSVAQEASMSVITRFFSAIATFVIALLISIGSVIMAVILFIIVLYVTYLQILKKWQNSQICKQCEKYLLVEISNFEQSHVLLTGLDNAVTVIVEEYEQEQLTILNQIFSGTSYDMSSSEQKEINRFMELKGSWNKIKYE